ncbi:MAG: hypothetical protein KA771_03980 [Spirochaetales bacterium]|nr:hypothetical protein [Spirochaetales bacterium]
MLQSGKPQIAKINNSSQITFAYKSIIVLFFFLTGCNTSRSTLLIPRQIPTDAFGMAHAGERCTEEENTLLNELGVAWIRNTFRWDTIQIRPEQWDFQRWDRYVENAEKTGKKILAVLGYDTAWIYGENRTKTRRRYIEPENIPYFLQYVEVVVRRYRGKIGAYEIWNEPNWTFWKGSNEDFFQLCTAAARRIKEVAPESYVVIGSFLRVPDSFIQGLFQAGAFSYADGVSFHPYALDSDGVVGQYDKLVRILKEEGFQGDVWVTEVGYPTGGLYITRVSEGEFPARVIKTLVGLLTRGARVVFWYELFDKFPEGKAPNPFNSELFFGLAYPDYSLKSGAMAYGLTARKIAGAHYQPDFLEVSPALSKSVEAFLFQGKAGSWRLILWSRQGEVQVRISPLTGCFQYEISIGEPVLILEKADVYFINENPTFLEWQDPVQNSYYIEQVRILDG